MNQIKFKFTKSKLIIIVILLITFGVTYFVYEDTYNLTAASDKLSPAINDYIMLAQQEPLSGYCIICIYFYPE